MISAPCVSLTDYRAGLPSSGSTAQKGPCAILLEVRLWDGDVLPYLQSIMRQPGRSLSSLQPLGASDFGIVDCPGSPRTDHSFPAGLVGAAIPFVDEQIARRSLPQLRRPQLACQCAAVPCLNCSPCRRNACQTLICFRVLAFPRSCGRPRREEEQSCDGADEKPNRHRHQYNRSARRARHLMAAITHASCIVSLLVSMIRYLG